MNKNVSANKTGLFSLVVIFALVVLLSIYFAIRVQADSLTSGVTIDLRAKPDSVYVADKVREISFDLVIENQESKEVPFQGFLEFGGFWWLGPSVENPCPVSFSLPAEVTDYWGDCNGLNRSYFLRFQGKLAPLQKTIITISAFTSNNWVGETHDAVRTEVEAEGFELKKSLTLLATDPDIRISIQGFVSKALIGSGVESTFVVINNGDTTSFSGGILAINFVGEKPAADYRLPDGWSVIYTDCFSYLCYAGITGEMLSGQTITIEASFLPVRIGFYPRSLMIYTTIKGKIVGHIDSVLVEYGVYLPYIYKSM